MSDLILSASDRDARLVVTVRNGGREPVRIWRQDNSWGWSSFELLVAHAARPEVQHTLRPKPVIWTANLPSYVELGPAESTEFEFRAGHPNWEGLDSVRPIRDHELAVRVVLRIRESPEATDLAIFIGVAASSLCVSHPPHRWLFAENR